MKKSVLFIMTFPMRLTALDWALALPQKAGLMMLFGFGKDLL